MYSIHNRDDSEKLKKLQESKSSLKAERLKQLLGKQDFHYDMKKFLNLLRKIRKKVKTKPS